MHYFAAIEAYSPLSEQESADKAVILEYARKFPDTILTRENRIAHLTSSGLVLNPERDKVLMIHHNIYNTWAWTGGHADGDSDLLAVALREAQEETGAKDIVPLCEKILSLDILPVWGHRKRGAYVATHLHLSASYVLTAPEDTPLQSCPEENSGVQWIPTNRISDFSNEPELIGIYQKLIQRARKI